jgi:ABC-type sugar transport system substrate-binding protein
MVVPELTITAIADLAKGAEARAAQLGDVHVSVLGTNTDSQQVADADDFISQHVNALIIDALDSPPMVPVLKQAAAAKIPVFVVVANVPGVKKTVIEADETNGGYQAGRYMAATLGSGQIGLVTGSAGDYTNGLRVSGFMKGIRGSHLHVVAQIAGNWDRPTALNVANDMLTGHPPLKGIFALNDDMAFGVLSAIKGQGRSDVELVGYNGASDGLKAVWDGQFAATVMLRLFGVGEKAVNYAVAASHGQPVPAESVYQPYLVDKKIMQSIIAGKTQVPADIKASVEAAATGS